MRGIYGAKTKNDRQDAYKIAHLLRGGNFPLAYVYPAEWRPTRDLLRRRRYVKRSRADLLTHTQNPVTPYNLAHDPHSENLSEAQRSFETPGSLGLE